MPFVGTQRSLDLQERKVMPEKQGDLCCLAYVPMVQKFLANRSWTTIHRIRKDVLDGSWKTMFLNSRRETFSLQFDEGDFVTAVDLAWQVFFIFYALKYEIERKKINGGVLTRDD